MRFVVCRSSYPLSLQHLPTRLPNRTHPYRPTPSLFNGTQLPDPKYSTPSSRRALPFRHIVLLLHVGSCEINIEFPHSAKGLILLDQPDPTAQYRCLSPYITCWSHIVGRLGCGYGACPRESGSTNGGTTPKGHWCARLSPIQSAIITKISKILQTEVHNC